jgi:isopenicillin N synthase-like dioxygenase
VDGAWVSCPPHPDSFVVNVGDLLQRWTNDRWRSDVHRVAPAGSDEEVPSRLVCVFFSGPASKQLITPLPSCCADGVHHEPITAGEHLAGKIARTRT